MHVFSIESVYSFPQILKGIYDWKNVKNEWFNETLEQCFSSVVPKLPVAAYFYDTGKKFTSPSKTTI